jgi:polysaccharide export outer membrane protein
MRYLLGFVFSFLLGASAVHGQAIVALRVGDLFELRLSGMPQEYAQEFTAQYAVNPEGSINVPLIGQVKALGLTGSQLEQEIQNKMIADKIFTHPTVLISIVQGNRYVSVSGGVRAPQRLPWSNDLTLSSAIGNCQGLSDFGSGKGVRIIRDGKVAGTFNLKDIQRDPGIDPKLLPGDQVVVRE